MDWQKLISDLLNAGWSQTAIGREVGKSQAWVSAVLRNAFKDIPWHTGERLRKLHARVCRRKKSTKQSKGDS